MLFVWGKARLRFTIRIVLSEKRKSNAAGVHKSVILQTKNNREHENIY